MKTNGAKAVPATLPVVRRAIYTRKSTEDGLEQQFNSLDAQRESAEAYVRSQAGEGWTCLPERYDDGGYTGGNMERPGLNRLLADIEAGKIDCVVVYKVDRLSRSLLDFARMMSTFEAHRVSFVSVTQLFNTANSMGRLMLNVLLSFAQFEREIISERTRDKMAATRRKGKFAGGRPPLGYDVDTRGTRLIVNEDEAVRVRAIFALYLEHEALLPVVQELARRGWSNKLWRSRDGREGGGQPFTKTSLHRLLVNPVYAGRVRYKTEVHPGEQAALVTPEVFDRVQAVFRRNGRTGGGLVRNQFGALLKGLLRCTCCDSAMVPSHTTRRQTRRYRYYTCCSAQKRGWDTCPSRSIPAAEIERLVVDRVRVAARDPALLSATAEEARRQDEARLLELDSERRVLERDLARWQDDERRLARPVGASDADDPRLVRLADLQERARLAETRLFRVREQIALVRGRRPDPEDVERALTLFTPVWESLSPAEQARAVRLLVARVDYDGAAGKVAIHFHDAGLSTLADELARTGPKRNAHE
jgi:site-specific DNA recombinase